MNVLINADEWAAPWTRQFALSSLKKSKLTPDWVETTQYLRDCKLEFNKSGLITIDFNQVNQLLTQDLKEFRNTINAEFKNTVKEQKKKTLKHIQKLNLSDRDIISKYLNESNNGFAKILAPQLSNNLNWIIHTDKADWAQPFFVRNIINNEDLLSRCLAEQLEFWFVDAGYTNFLEAKQKVWHRLVKNHIHHGQQTREFPTDRMHLFSKLPKGWRRKGSTILVIESSPGHYLMRGTTVSAWRDYVTQELRKHTDRQIEFRPKNADRKSRVSVYETLKETKDYYCVVSDSSAAAVEAIWTGTPVITLEQHITNSVSRRNLADINDLYKYDIERWLAMLSYSQYTFDELCDGTAVSIVKEYFDA